MAGLEQAGGGETRGHSKGPKRPQPNLPVQVLVDLAKHSKFIKAKMCTQKEKAKDLKE